MTLEPLVPRLAVQTAGGAAVVHFAGPRVTLSDQVTLGLAPQFNALAEDHGGRPVFLHLGNVDFLCSTALGLILKLHKRAQTLGGSLTLCGLPDDLYEVFTVTRLHTVVRIHRGPGPAGPPGVLIVDDEEAVRSFLETGLRPAGFATWPAASGAEAVDLCRQLSVAVNLVLLDVDLPGWDGPQTLGELSRLRPELRFCFLTGGSADADEDLLRRGAVCVFHKPLVLSEVAAALHRLATPVA
jgi:anti-anti-sigma factor